MNFTLHAPLVGDMKDVHALLMGVTEAGVILPRSLSDLYGHVRDFVLIRDEGGRLAGCCALAIIWEDIAEVRSLVVKPEYRRLGCGKMLVEACINNALAMGVRRVFTLTYQTEFFATLGFTEVGKDILPHKIWADCVHCPKFPDCDEIAMLRVL